jgi:hypothetical protein
MAHIAGSVCVVTLIVFVILFILKTITKMKSPVDTGYYKVWKLFTSIMLLTLVTLSFQGELSVFWPAFLIVFLWTLEWVYDRDFVKSNLGSPIWFRKKPAASFEYIKESSRKELPGFFSTSHVTLARLEEVVRLGPSTGLDFSEVTICFQADDEISAFGFYAIVSAAVSKLSSDYPEGISEPETHRLMREWTSPSPHIYSEVLSIEYHTENKVVLI